MFYYHKGLTRAARRTVATAITIAGRQGCTAVDTGHLLLAMLQTGRGTAVEFLRRKQITVTALSACASQRACTGRPLHLRGRNLAPESRKALEKAGVEIVFYDALTPGERDYTAILTKLKSATPDVVFFTGYYPETGMLLRQKKEMGWDVPMMGGDAANHQDLVKIAGADAAKGYFFISPPLPQDMDTQEARHFLEAYKARYQSVPVSVWAVVAGDAYKVIEAALAAGKTDPEDMAQWLKQLKDMPGLTGKLGFDEKGDRVGEFYRSYMVDEQGKFILLPQK